MDSTRQTRREWLQTFAALSGAAVLAPIAEGCTSAGGASGETGAPPLGAQGSAGGASEDALPRAKPASWDPIAFNRERGNAGAIPESYRAQINGPDGATAHLGKHLPYVPTTIASAVPAGMLPLMWGDPAKGHAKHPNAPRSESNREGHWYNWIKIRKATDGDAQEIESRFSNWPTTEPTDNGRYAAFEGTDPAADAGKNTVYLVALPPDVRPGDTVRVHAHCLTHGEYVDFVTVPTRA